MRLERNRSPERLAEKPSKRNVEKAEAILLQHEADHRFVSNDEFDGRDDHVAIDNATLTPDEVAERIIDAFRLARA